MAKPLRVDQMWFGGDEVVKWGSLRMVLFLIRMESNREGSWRVTREGEEKRRCIEREGEGGLIPSRSMFLSKESGKGQEVSQHKATRQPLLRR